MIGGFVGGDTVAGVLATGLADAGEPTLFVDIGTNGEIVLSGRGASFRRPRPPPARPSRAPASPRHARQRPGPSKRWSSTAGLRINVIGNVPPAGLCGSALIDAAAELLRHGLLDAARTPAFARPIACRRARRACPADRALRRQAGFRTGRRGRNGPRPADPAHPARSPRAATGRRGDPRGIVLLLRAGRPGAARTSIACRWAAGSAISSAAATPSGSACCPGRSSIGGFATRATRRWPGAAGGRFAACPGSGRRGGPADRARRSLARARISTAFAEAMIFPEEGRRAISPSPGGRGESCRSSARRLCLSITEPLSATDVMLSITYAVAPIPSPPAPLPKGEGSHKQIIKLPRVHRPGAECGSCRELRVVRARRRADGDPVDDVDRRPGVRKMPKRVTPNMPLKTAVPRVRRISAPAPTETIRGMTPKMKAKEVMMIGRSRSRQAASVAS